MWASANVAEDPARCSGGPHCQPGTWWKAEGATLLSVMDMESRSAHHWISRAVAALAAGVEDVAGAHVVRGSRGRSS